MRLNSTATAAAAMKHMGTDGSIVHGQHDSALPAVVGQQLPAAPCYAAQEGMATRNKLWNAYSSPLAC